MFNGAKAFNQDISGWKSLAVVQQCQDFCVDAGSLKRPLLPNWVSNCGEPRMLKTVTVILVHAETESLLDTLIPVTDNTQPPTRCIVFVHNQDSRQLGPRSRHPRSLSQSSRAVHPVCASP